MEYEFTDRYETLGIPRPDPATMCQGQCEGVGYYPQFLDGSWLSGSPRLEKIEIPVVAVDDLLEVLDSPAKMSQLDKVSINFACPDPTHEEIRRWHESHNAPDAHGGDGGKCDGWHFIKCPDCEGTGKAKDATIDLVEVRDADLVNLD